MRTAPVTLADVSLDTVFVRDPREVQAALELEYSGKGDDQAAALAGRLLRGYLNVTAESASAAAAMAASQDAVIMPSPATMAAQQHTLYLDPVQQQFQQQQLQQQQASGADGTSGKGGRSTSVSVSAANSGMGAAFGVAESPGSRVTTPHVRNGSKVRDLFTLNAWRC